MGEYNINLFNENTNGRYLRKKWYHIDIYISLKRIDRLEYYLVIWLNMGSHVVMSSRNEEWSTIDSAIEQSTTIFTILARMRSCFLSFGLNVEGWPLK